MRIIQLLLIAFMTVSSGWSYGQKKLSPLVMPSLTELPDSLKGKGLEELSVIFNTDKNPSMHNFIDVYARHFDPIREDVHRVFEIGVFNGASHKMWKCYFDSVEVYGIDIKEKPWIERLGIQVFIANQSNRSHLQRFVDSTGGQFDIIIDDGGHTMEQQQVSLGFLFKHLKPGGLYIVEDVHTSIPKFYDQETYGVEPSLENTTLTLVNNYVMTEKVNSGYMLPAEMIYMEQNIEYVELYKRKNSMHSTLCVFKKKDHEVK